jgi:hypothetical protein
VYCGLGLQSREGESGGLRCGKICTGAGVDTSAENINFLGARPEPDLRPQLPAFRVSGPTIQVVLRDLKNRHSMFCRNGSRLAARKATSESLAAQNFFRVLFNWSSGESCKGTRT